MGTAGMRAAALCAAALVGALSSFPAAAALVGSGWPRGILYDIDAETGEASNPRSTGLVRLIGITDGGDGYLYGFGTRDPAVFNAAPLILGAAAIAGCWLPASRAARGDTLVAIRAD